MNTKGVLTGKTVLVTGGARGIGRALCEEFGSAGAALALCDVDTDTAQSAALQMANAGLKVRCFTLDVRDRDAWTTVVAQIEAELGPVDVLIGNAGIMAVGPVLDLTGETEARQVDINLNGLIHGLHAVLPGMLSRGSGQIVHIASLAGRIPTPFGAVYAATKFGAIGLTEALRHELHGSGVTLTSVMPGFVQTELVTGLATPTWPKPSTPKAVARATLRGVLKRKGRVYVPWFTGILSVLPWLLPHSLSIWLSRLFGVHTILKPVDAAARTAYRARAVTVQRQGQAER